MYVCVLHHFVIQYFINIYLFVIELSFTSISHPNVVTFLLFSSSFFRLYWGRSLRTVGLSNWHWPDDVLRFLVPFRPTSIGFDCKLKLFLATIVAKYLVRGTNVRNMFAHCFPDEHNGNFL